ncbi:methyltransferase domain-containing protein [Natronomonas sp.]|uniref:methyltransferase domain-containing protein n=1 Tax=Natronomonas sp. TaxID=2184060 RepID=UPI0026208F48|nr:methyltransferase domain-containing protein [Natronomonas sp.]
MYLLEFVGEDDGFALREAASRGSGVGLLAPGLGTARGVERAETLAYTRRVCRLVGTCDPGIDAAAALAETTGTDRSGTVAVRCRDVRGLSGVDTQAVERRLGSVLVDRGFGVDLEDPTHTLVALFSDGLAALGWLETGAIRGFAARKPTKKPFFQPGSMAPMDARALANIAGAGPGRRILDPMCGTGGVLVEAGLAGADVVGVDAQRRMVAGSERNLRRYLERGSVVCGDATSLPFADGGFDGVVFDAPYGRQSKVEAGSLEGLVGGALTEARRVGTRAVLVGDRSWAAAAESAGWRVTDRFERPVHASLVRHVHVLA